jgi:protein tyrosine/serine phosphatase
MGRGACCSTALVRNISLLFTWPTTRPEASHVIRCIELIRVYVAGKDRTGVLSALILSLFEATDDLIAQDYALTRIGTEPFREVLLGKLTQQMGEDGKGLRLDTPGFLEMCSVRGPTIVAFLKSMDEKWGGEGNGVKGYLTEVIGLTEEDITKIKGKFWAGKA